MNQSEKNKEKNDLLRALFYPTVFIIILWIVKLAEVVFHWPLTNFGLVPRSINYLPGILTTPFLHADFLHLLSNTGPVFILGSFLFYFYKAIAWRVILWIYVLSGIWLWIGGREAMHIGASGLVYGLAAFLFLSGIFSKNTALMTVTLIITFLYGSLIWGFFPEFFPKENISWEGHLFGFIAGVLMALYFRKEIPQPKQYQWDEEELDPSEAPFWETDLPSDKTALEQDAKATYFRRK